MSQFYCRENDLILFHTSSSSLPKLPDQSLNGNQAKECKRRSEPNCETDGSSSNESWS